MLIAMVPFRKGHGFAQFIHLLPTTRSFAMSRILITGASGTIGRHLVQSLTAQGTPFEVMRSKPVADGRTRVGSYDDVASLTAAFADIDTLFVLLPLTPNKLTHARHVAAAAKTAGVSHIVRSSGAGADPAAGFALPRLQGQVDEILASTGLATTFLRPAGFMQNYLSFMADMVRGGMIYGATADAAQSLIDARDIAAVAARVLVNPAPHAGQAYTLTGGEALTDSQRAAVLSQALGRPVGFTAIAPQAATDAMRQMGMPDELVSWMASLNELVSAGYAAGISPDVQNLLGRAPIGFAQFAAEHQAAWR